MAQLVLTSDTLAGTPATGTLEYNGQFFGTDSASVANHIYALSKTDFDISNMSRDKIEELVWLKNEMQKDYEKWRAESNIKSSTKKSLSDDIITKFNWIPSEREFIDYVKSNKDEFTKAWLTNNPSWLKSFYTNLRLEKAKSDGEVYSVLSSADMDFIYENRLKKYYDSWDKEWFKKEAKFLYDKWVIKSLDGFNTWMNKNIINPK